MIPELAALPPADLATLRAEYASLSLGDKRHYCALLLDALAPNTHRQELARFLHGRMALRGRGKHKRLVRVFQNPRVRA